uniref:Fras1 related extracellular matrix 1b n=1 Tax=Neogobius melanostomus TaxID=47308 RepID=A0A8C6SIF6_9GOBI
MESVLPLQVTRGRSAFVTPQHLSIRVAPKADCKAEVVLNEPITLRVGGVTPQVFDCSFLEDEVVYEHSGNPLLQEDSVLIRVYSFSASQTRVQTVVLPVLVVEPVSPLVSFTPLLVPVFLGLSNAIDASVLQIHSPPDQSCSVRLLQVQVPTVGQLVTVDNAQNNVPNNALNNALNNATDPCLDRTQPVVFLKFSCEDFLRSGLRYQHLSPPSPPTDYIPLSVELRERGTRRLSQSESLWLPVRVTSALPDQPPRASFMASSILEVDQFVLTPVTVATLDAEDAETPRDRLVFNVTAPPSELMESVILTFSSLQVEFQVFDGSFQASAPIVVHISIRTSETNAPRVSWNMGLVLLEGQSRPISWEQLQIVDKDNLQQVSVVAVDGPQHGTLTVRGVKSFMFRVADLRRGDVVYRHDDSDTTQDHIVFRISDGRHSLRHRFPIAVLPRDDSPPFLLNNVALQVREGGQVQVRDYLLAADLDSSDNYITYTVTTRPRAGRLVRKARPEDRGVEVETFLQKELIQGQIYYQHDGDETHEDSFDFRLSDPHEPPNLSQTVVVHVFPVKDQVPVQVQGSVRTLTVREDQVVYITPEQLHFRDEEHPDQDLTFTITKACPAPADLSNVMDAGRLFYTDNSQSMKRDHMVPVLKSFTQDIGLEPLLVRFEFSVRDLQGGTVSGLDFNITVLPVDDQKPQAFSNVVRVEEGGVAFLTEEHLVVRDRDSPEEKLSLRVLKEGAEVLLHLTALRSVSVRYLHDDSETTADEVELSVSDGTNSILPMNDEAPVLGRLLLDALVCNESGSVRVSLDHLRASDRDSEDLRLVYMLARAPRFGTLQRSGFNVDRFTQQDLLKAWSSTDTQEIGAAAVMDTVTLIISDAEAGQTDGCCHGDAPPPPVPLHGSLPVYDLNVTILPVNNRPPVVTVGPELLSVEEGAVGCLCGRVLGATDLDTPPDDITFHLLTPPIHGFIENTLPSAGSEKSRAGIPVESFSLTELSGGFINYVQSRHKGAEPTADQLTLFANDGLHRSAPSAVYIIITPANDEPPVLHLRNFTVVEGGRVDMSPSLLDASDLDVPLDSLTFSVRVPPRHGRLVSTLSLYKRAKSKHPGSSGRLLASRSGLRLQFLHDGSETLQDSLELSLSDGERSILGTAFITVLPVDDQTPFCCSCRNSGLELDWGQTRLLSSLVLEAEDRDTEPDRITAAPAQSPVGHPFIAGLSRLQSGSDWAALSPGQNFSQTDVEMNRIRYVHVGGLAAGVRGHDSFRFTLSDRTNESPVQTFYITIRTQHRGNSTVQMTAQEALGNAVSVGVLVSTPGVPLWNFTQLDVTAQRVCYTHDNSHQGETDSFRSVLY